MHRKKKERRVNWTTFTEHFVIIEIEQRRSLFYTIDHFTSKTRAISTLH